MCKFKQIEKNSEKKSVRVQIEATKDRSLVQKQTQIGLSL